MDGDNEDLQPDELLELIQADDAKDAAAKTGDGNHHQSSGKTMEHSGRRKSAPPPRFVEQADRIYDTGRRKRGPPRKLDSFLGAIPQNKRLYLESNGLISSTATENVAGLERLMRLTTSWTHLISLKTQRNQCATVPRRLPRAKRLN